MILDKLSCLISTIITAAVCVLISVLYFEGIPVIRSIPLIGYLPVIGWVAEGEIGRRTAHAYSDGETAERLKWQEQRDKDIAMAEAERHARQTEIDAITARHAKDISDLRAKASQLISEAEQKAAEDEKTATADPACHGAPAVSRRVRDSLQDIRVKTPLGRH
jgi:hypothetical protein